MNDFGGEVGQQVGTANIRILLELFSALRGMISKIYDNYARNASPEMKLHQENLRKLRDDKARADYIQKIEGMTGFVKYADMERSGLPLTYTEVKCDDNDFKRLMELCKRDGVAVSSIMDARDREINNKKSHIVICFEKDSESILSLVKIINDEKIKAACEKEIAKTLCGGGDKPRPIQELTADERQHVDFLNGKIAEIIQADTYLHNDKAAESIRDTAAGENTELGCASAHPFETPGEEGRQVVAEVCVFERAVNRHTSRELDRGVIKFVADTRDPHKVVRCSSATAEYGSCKYIKTNYDVYCHGNHVLSCDDGRFDGRPKGYWYSVRDEMKAAGGFSNNVLIFNSEAEYSRHLQRFDSERDIALSFINAGAPHRNYGEIINRLNGRLNEIGFQAGEIGDGGPQPVPAAIRIGGTDAERAAYKAGPNYAEALTIVKQIVNYKALESLDNEVALAYARTVTATENTPEFDEAVEEHGALTERRKNALNLEMELIQQRSDICSVTIEREMRGGHGLVPSNRDKADSHAERVGDDARGHKTMEIWMGEVASARADAGAAAAGFKQHVFEAARHMPTPYDGAR